MECVSSVYISQSHNANYHSVVQGSHTRSYHHVWFLLDLTGREFRGNSPAFISCAHTRHRHFVT